MIRPKDFAVGLVLALCFVFVSSLRADEPTAGDKVAEAPKDLQIYLLIGQSNMAGRAPIPEEYAGVIDRCYLLNDKNEWEPAKNPLNRYSTIRKGLIMQKLCPGYGFALKMLKENKDLKIGLVVNARGGSKIEEWLGKSKYYWGIRSRAKVARQSGKIMGVLWHQGEGNSGEPEKYLDQLKTLIANLRTDLDDMDLPFVAGQITDNPHMAINDEIAKLPDSVQATAVAGSQGLTTIDRWHFDTKSQLLLGERYADEMLKLQRAAANKSEPTPPKDIMFIDTHVHAFPCTPNGLDTVADWMARNQIDRCIVSPLDHKGSRDYTEEDRRVMLENFQKYKGKIDRMCIINPEEVQSVEQAVEILKKEKADGAIAFGEHYGVGLNFDDPANLRLYEACEKVGLPVMFHIDQNKNMVEPGMRRVDNVLDKYPQCKLIAHAYWWRQLKDADRQLQEHPNLYADTSGDVVPNVLNRDRAFAREFIIRNQDKLLFGTDEGWWSFGKNPSPCKQYTFFEGLDLPDDVRYKLYRGNAEKLFGFKKDNANAQPVTAAP
ncbi:MAG: amidohydrolase family protein [Phycisphaera sp.]|nr:amidohydrolase family protein [Phycisphaera sp.]